MTKSAHIYAGSICAVGTAVLVGAAMHWQPASGLAFVICLALAAFASTRKVRLPGLTGTISPGFVFVLVSVGTLSWSETVAIAAVSGIVQCVWRPTSRPSPLQVAFSLGTMACSGVLAYFVAWGLAGAPDDIRGVVVRMGVAGVALLVSNTLIVSTIICLIQEGPF